jgi:hypothetical protein
LSQDLDGLQAGIIKNIAYWLNDSAGNPAGYVSGEPGNSSNDCVLKLALIASSRLQASESCSPAYCSREAGFLRYSGSHGNIARHVSSLTGFSGHEGSVLLLILL